MFVNEKLKCALVDQFCARFTFAWLFVDIDTIKIVNVYKPPPSRLIISTIQVFPHPISIQMTSIASIPNGVIIPSAQMENA